MSYHDKQGKIKRQISKQAITLALEGQWEEAISVNQGIIVSFPNDVDAYNRLGKAFMELGDYAKARESYTKASQMDQYNTIARKNLQRLEQLGDKAPESTNGKTEKAEPNLFIEEIGKAGVVNLYQIAPSDKLVKMMAGDKVVLNPQESSMVVSNLRGEYLGMVPSKQGQRLIKLMSGGNKYTAAVVASNENSISIIIRETYQDPSQISQVSFPGKRLEEIMPYVSDRVFRPEYEEEEGSGEDSAFGEDGADVHGEGGEDVEEEKEWEQEA